jgi:hypothetical protein
MPDHDLHCSRRRRPFRDEDRVAGITAKIMGDECTDVFYWCAACGVYTIRVYRDVFTGPETAHDSEPIPKEEGDRRLALVRTCPQPSDADCLCDGHRAYFGDWLG